MQHVTVWDTTWRLTLAKVEWCKFDTTWPFGVKSSVTTKVLYITGHVWNKRHLHLPKPLLNHRYTLWNGSVTIYLNSIATGICGSNFKRVIFEHIFKIQQHLLWNGPQVNITKHTLLGHARVTSFMKTDKINNQAWPAVVFEPNDMLSFWKLVMKIPFFIVCNSLQVYLFAYILISCNMKIKLFLFVLFSRLK